MIQLQQALMLEGRGVVSLVGAGGKTSLMFKLADEVAAAGDAVMTTTTTKILKPTPRQSSHLIISDSVDTIIRAAGDLLNNNQRHITVAASQVLPDNKFIGLPPEVIDALAETKLFRWIIAEADGDRIHYRAVNACIQFLPTLHGKALFTVESIKQTDGSLHPVQQALVDYHASQCGFCTPGFVMSLFALYQSDRPVNREVLNDVLSGNLCRCTGYRPIIEAGMHMHDYAAVKQHEQQLLRELRSIRSNEGLCLRTDSAQFHAPASVQELADLYQKNPDATLLAGGTDVGLWVTKQLRDLPEIIYLGNVDELRTIDETGTDIEIGAALSLEDAFNHLAGPYPELGELFRRFASLPVRNAGTLAGNIANGSPIGDTMPALICIDARVRLRLGSQIRELALEDLYLDYMKNAMQPGEFIEAVVIPKRDRQLQLQSYKLSKRFDQDISAVCAAFALRLNGDSVEGIKIAFGGLAAIPKRAVQAENFLVGNPWDEQTVRQAMELLKQDYTPMTDMRASAAYRSQVSANLLYRFYLQTRSDQPLSVFGDCA